MTDLEKRIYVATLNCLFRVGSGEVAHMMSNLDVPVAHMMSNLDVPCTYDE